MNLLAKIADEHNLESSFYSCLQGKRSAYSPQLTFLKLDSHIVSLKQKILTGQNYPWGGYREFYICDPKRRLISSAPFIDRVVHRAIYNVLEPELDQHLIPNTFACRTGKGNGRAVGQLQEIIRKHDFYYAVKIDVRKYFSSIQHGRLLGKFKQVMNDDSTFGLIKGLLRSHPLNRGGVGLPLGNLTSQIFANYYLKDIDDFLYKATSANYIRYMDDLIFFTKDKNEASRILSEVLLMGKKEKLVFPTHKRVWIKNTSIPFLGFLINRDGFCPLNRNVRRFNRRLNKKIQTNASLSELEQSKVSYNAWRDYLIRVAC